MLGIFKHSRNKPIATTAKVTKAAPEPRPQTQTIPVTDQTIDYLKGADPDDILELMLPALVQEQQKRLVSTAKELEQIDQRLAKLYASRDDIYSVMAANQNNGATDF